MAQHAFLSSSERHTHTHRKMLSSWPIPSSFESILVVTWAAKSRTLHRFTPEGGQRDLFLQPGVLHNLCMHRVLGGGVSTGYGRVCVWLPLLSVSLSLVSLSVTPESKSW